MNEQTKIPSIQSFDIDHLGIVASVVDEIGLVQQIDRLLGTHDQQHLSSGQLVKAMILNGLGYRVCSRHKRTLLSFSLV
jgi:hypothetical protein